MNQSTLVLQRHRMAVCALVCWSLGIAPIAQPQAWAAATPVPLADRPVFTAVSVPGNLALTLSVEFPTASTPSYKTGYSSATTYLGYFDPNKCYRYNLDTNNPATGSYFYAVATSATKTCTASSQWSGNYLNWASMQSLDNFRWVLTGGNRVVDTATETVLQKTHFGSQGTGYAPDKTISNSGTISGATPLGWSSLTTSIANRGTAMLFSSCAISGSSTITDYSESTTLQACSKSTSRAYRVYINVKVCDSAPDSANYHNCKAYGSVYKPEGLIQKYSDKLRYAAFGYLNDGNIKRDGGVLRAAMTYVGPTQPVPGSAPITNNAPEWDGSTGQMLANPASADALATETEANAAGYPVSVPNSGVMNYLNKFGYYAANAGSSTPYKNYDPVSEMYYAATRYFRNLGDVPEYSSISNAGSTGTMNTWVDGFPIVRSWRDPMVYSCQRNFILGIGDIYTHRDTNLPGSTIKTSDEPTTPASVDADTAINVKTATDMVGQLEGLSNLGSNRGPRNDSQFIAGLAYHTHTTDIRADLAGKQAISTYWMDVLEAPYEHRNKYWLAAKFGGFEVPENFDPYASGNGTSTLPLDSWNKDNAQVNGTTQLRPSNYFTANDPASMKSGLEEAFAKIANEASKTSTTSIATASPNVSTGNASYGSTYDPESWTGDVTASSLNFAPNGTLTRTLVWSAAQNLDNAAAASATWHANTRKVVTFCDAASTPGGIAFTTTALAACDTATADVTTRRLNYGTFEAISGVAADRQSKSNYLAYLRGNRTSEIKNNGPYRTRESLLGDIVGSKLLAVSRPSSPYADETNPGYNAFRTTYASRKTVVYVGANDGMLHAFDGSITDDSTGGQELFAFIPSFVYGTDSTGPTSGLASLGTPAFEHRYLVNGPVMNFDVDFNRAGAPTAETSDWRTILIGGLGKGGRGYYAIDVTAPESWTDQDESALAGSVLWEFPASSDATTRARMGHSFGEPSVVKTAKYGWVVIFSSGYNNDDGKGYFFIVNPKTGALLETVEIDEGTESTPLNMANQRAFIPNYTDYTADALYAGDLRGNVWRLDLTPTEGSYAAPIKIATLTNADGHLQPVTTRPLIEVDPRTKKRYVLIGTGRLLAESDIVSSSLQSFYAIADGTGQAGGFWSTPPGQEAFPIERSALAANTSLLDGIGSAPASSLGWYLDLSGKPAPTLETNEETTEEGTVEIAERVDVNPDANFGIVAFAANLPNGDACNPSGTSRVFGLRIGDGRSVLTNSEGGRVSYVNNTTGTITDVLIQRTNGRIRLNVGDSSGDARNVPGDLSSGLGITRLNWRVVVPE